MKLLRTALAGFLVLALAGVGYVAQSKPVAGVAMSEAAQKFLDRLPPDLRARATFPFDDQERTNWHFVPMQDRDKKPTRKGLRLEDMTAEQREAALELVKAGTSPQGYEQATMIMSLENILHELEKNGANVRSPTWYFFSVFGTPSPTGRWGWRVEGHHLSLNYVVDGGRVTAFTPAFFGANPATVKDGPRKGLRTLPEVEDLALDLFRSLDDGQRKLALLPKQVPEVSDKKGPQVGEPAGVPASQMKEQQQTTLKRLLQAYTSRLPAEVSQSEMQRVEQAGIDTVYFAFAGSTEPGVPHSYRLQGPTFVAEFLNVQADSARNPANHIHSVWRHLPADFGLARQ